jgi:hypothetical protein
MPRSSRLGISEGCGLCAATPPIFHQNFPKLRDYPTFTYITCTNGRGKNAIDATFPNDYA